MLDAQQIQDHLKGQMERHVDRDGRWDNIRAARNGDLATIAPDLFSDDLPRPIVANFIDTVARDLAEMLAPLPSFQCSSATMQSDTARKFADKRTKILQNYIFRSKLEKQMLEGADHFNTYGVCVFYLEPDFDEKLPRICVEDPTGGYADFDRWGRVRSYTKRFFQNAYELAQMFPEYAPIVFEGAKEIIPGSGTQCEIIRYCDKDQIALVLVGKEPVMLTSVSNPLRETPVVVARRAWLHTNQYKGQFDDAVWVQLARNSLAVLNLEAVQKSVQAPLAVPNDLQEFPVGPDSILRTGMPEKVRRVGLELPTGAFQESAVLMEELRTGTRYPAARTGGVDANIITGRGVQALLGGFEGQISAGQLAIRDALMDVARMCFKLDEVYWPNLTKDVRGTESGTPFELSYRPSKDIKGDHSADIQYGFAAGMDPNRAVVMLLQLRGDKLISRDYFQRQLPFGINVTEEQSKVAVEDIRESIMQGVYAYVQAIPALAQQGMDPSEPVIKAAMLVKGIQKGDAIEDVVSAVFMPAPVPAQEQPAEGGPPGMGGPGGAGGFGGTTGGLTESGRLVGVPPGQAGQSPGGRPDLGVYLAGLTGQGQPQMSAYTMRRRRI